MEDHHAALLLDLLSKYAAEYGKDSDPLHVLSVQTVAADLIDTVPYEMLPKAPALCVWGYEYETISSAEEQIARLHAAGWRIADDGDPYRPNVV